ncbi:MAG: GAF domain-containing protein, partial [Verrucomicrobiota bacterium]
MSGHSGDLPPEFDLSEKFRRLVEVGLALTAESDVSSLLSRILFEARRFTGAEAGTLYLVTPERKLQFSVVQNDGLRHSEVLAGNGTQPITIEISRTSIAGRVTMTGAPLNIPDVRDLPESCGFHFDSSFDQKTGYCSRSMLVVPMKTPDGHIVGVIQLINARRPDSDAIAVFPAEQEELVLCLASQAAVALNNARLTSELQHAYSEAIH